MPQNRVIAIIGAGFSGTMAAVHLAVKAREPLEILLIERSGLFARGVAYGTRDSSHLLNVPASNMSAFPGIPDHFVRWAKGHGLNETSFAPRKLYGDYLTEILREAPAAANETLRFKEIADEVVGIDLGKERFTLRLKKGEGAQADEVILALGNFPAGVREKIPFPKDDGVRVTGAWDERGLEGIGPEDRVLILGSGLTMIDTVLTLKARGLRPPIQVISRHGRLSQPFQAAVRGATDVAPGERVSLSHTVRKFRREKRGPAEAGNGWRPVLSSLRPITPNLWRGFSFPERARFLRHLRSLWDTHRHQMAPEIAERIAAWRAEGSLRIAAARILALRAKSEGTLVTFRRRGATVEESLPVDRVINCLGLEGDFATMKHPLIESLREGRLIRPDPLGLGIDVTRDGRIIAGDGVPSNRLFALGSLRRGECWESVAVPELRVQAENLAELLILKKGNGSAR